MRLELLELSVRPNDFGLSIPLLPTRRHERLSAEDFSAEMILKFNLPLSSSER